jgi:hypothetical protein
MTVYTYSCRTQHDSNDLTELIEAASLPYFGRLGPAIRMAITLDGWPALETSIWKRPAAAVLYDKLRTGDVVMFYGLERCFTSARNLFKVVDGLTDMDVRSVILDLGLTMGTPHSDALFSCIQRLMGIPAALTAALKEPRKV